MNHNSNFEILIHIPIDFCSGIRLVRSANFADSARQKSLPTSTEIWLIIAMRRFCGVLNCHGGNLNYHSGVLNYHGGISSLPTQPPDTHP